MRALLYLYPRAWRDRYGAELSDLIASEPRSLRLYLDLIAGAVDARVNPQWTPASTPNEGPKTMNSLLVSCGRDRFSTRANAVSAGLMLGCSLLLVLVHAALVRQFGKEPWVQALLYSTFNIALVIASMPTYLRNYRPSVRAALLLFGIAASYGFFYGVTLLGERI